tara:strand:- start:1157 stop:1285 length:129 start_codon:yes stop_codon:yes gene_type:complete
MSSNNVIHTIQISVKAHFGDVERKFENVFEETVFDTETFEFD